MLLNVTIRSEYVTYLPSYFLFSVKRCRGVVAKIFEQIRFRVDANAFEDAIFSSREDVEVLRDFNFFNSSRHLSQSCIIIFKT